MVGEGAPRTKQGPELCYSVGEVMGEKRRYDSAKRCMIRSEGTCPIQKIGSTYQPRHSYRSQKPRPLGRPLHRCATVVAEPRPDLPNCMMLACYRRRVNRRVNVAGQAHPGFHACFSARQDAALALEGEQLVLRLQKRHLQLEAMVASLQRRARRTMVHRCQWKVAVNVRAERCSHRHC